MESSTLDTKYQKLATEYSKLRAQANVLKKAVLDEQCKNSNLREALRQKEAALRRAEQEVDSLGFRNRQLEHRVAFLQEDFKKESNKSTKNQKPNSKLKNIATKDSNLDPLLADEFQKKILENAQLTSLIDDKSREIVLHNDRIKELEKQIEKRITEGMEVERRLRKEIDTLTARNSDLETKVVEAGSMIGSEDALSVSGSDNTPLHTNSSSSEEKIAFLEKEVFHWRTQCEILKISDVLPIEQSKDKTLNGASSSSSENKSASETYQQELSKENVLHNHFSRKFIELLEAKCMAESRLASYLSEFENLQSCLEHLMQELSERKEEISKGARIILLLEEDLATTRINYEEQISVLTEQVISLSEQLASSK